MVRLSRERYSALTVVELLVVLAVIAFLFQLSLPAVGTSKEGARKVLCKNRLHQLGVASQLHLETHGYFPTGGWGSTYLANPDRGYGSGQPGGWAYSVLAYTDENELRELGVGESPDTDQIQPGLASLYQSAPDFLYCPTRRLPRAYPAVFEGVGAWNLYATKWVKELPGVTKTDYAANSGDALHHAAYSFRGLLWNPDSYSQLESEKPQWTETDDPDSPYYQTGTIYYRSEVGPEHVADGLSKTYLVGEKFMMPESYKDVRAVSGQGRFSDNNSAWSGYEWDNQRVAWRPGAMKDEVHYLPKRDREGAVASSIWSFGSAHPESMNMMFADGSVAEIGYDIDTLVHRASANRQDGGYFLNAGP